MTVQTRALLTQLRGQLRVIRALVIREALGRYGTESIGFFWVVAEPLLLSCGVVVVWAILIQSHSQMGSIGIIPFMLTGYSHLQLWRQSALGASLSIRRGTWLMYHSNVHIVDVLIARCLLASVSIFASFVVAYGIAYLFGAVGPVSDPLLVVVAWLLDTLFCFGFALIIAGLSELSETVEKLVHPLMYLTLPITGTFSMTAWLPPEVQVVMNWSPLVNAMEMFRAGVFSETVKTYWNAWFILVSALLVIAIGIPLVSLARRRVQAH